MLYLGAVSTARAYALANDVELSFLSTDEDLIANLDESWFRQSILVLIDNAVKFSKPDDKIKITLEKKSGKAVIKVIDEGPGIEEEALDHLFERYYQAKEGQKREGTGLGLAIAHWIITGHKGKIWAENVSDAEKQSIKQDLNANNGTQTGAIMNVEVELIE